MNEIVYLYASPETAAESEKIRDWLKDRGVEVRYTLVQPGSEEARLVESLSRAIEQPYPLLRVGEKIRWLAYGATPEAVALVLAPESQDPVTVDQFPIRVFSTHWCPDCHRVKRVLEDSGLSFKEIFLENQPEAASLIIAWSGGRRVVPTVWLGERIVAFNPQGQQIVKRYTLAAVGNG